MTEPAQLDIYGHEVPLDQVEPLEGGDAGHSAPSPSSGPAEEAQATTGLLKRAVMEGVEADGADPSAHVGEAARQLGLGEVRASSGDRAAVPAPDGRRGPTGNRGLAPSPGFTNEIPF